MAWYDAAHNSVTQDARDPMGSTCAYTARNVGTDVYTVKDADGNDLTATISATAGGPGVGVITIDLPAGY